MLENYEFQKNSIMMIIIAMGFNKNNGFKLEILFNHAEKIVAKK